MDELITLLDQDSISNYDNIAEKRDLYLQKLYEFLGPDTLNDYIKRYVAHSIEDPIWMTTPVDLLIGGQQLTQISETQNSKVIDKFKKKFKNLQGSCTHLSDVLAELSIATCVGFNYDIELDKKTGLGKKDADIYVPKSSIYLEVKNYMIGRSKFETSAAKDIQKLELNGLKGSYRAGDYELVKQENSDIFLAIDMSNYDPKKQIIEMLNSAEAKFSQNQTAILFIVGIARNYIPICRKTIDEWAENHPNSLIKGVFIVSSRRSTDNIRSTCWHELIPDQNISDFLSTAELV
jgi:hypothetical protein